MMLWLVRCLLIALSLAGWFWTQAWIARRPFPSHGLQDRVHDFTQSLNRWLLEHPRHANVLLIITSLLIDVVAIGIILGAVFGASFGPFLGLFLLFVLRQICQGLIALPPPPGMIWRNPGVPSLFVTYGTPNDLFFSGHTAISVYGALEMAHHLGSWGVVLGIAFATIEAVTVLLLRAHYTMDVFAGAVTALWVWTIAQTLAPAIDAALSSLI